MPFTSKTEVLTVELTGKSKFTKSFVVSSSREAARKLDELATELHRKENTKLINGDKKSF